MKLKNAFYYVLIVIESIMQDCFVFCLRKIVLKKVKEINVGLAKFGKRKRLLQFELL